MAGAGVAAGVLSGVETAGVVAGAGVVSVAAGVVLNHLYEFSDNGQIRNYMNLKLILYTSLFP